MISFWPKSNLLSHHVALTSKQLRLQVHSIEGVGDLVIVRLNLSCWEQSAGLAIITLVEEGKKKKKEQIQCRHR